MDTLNKTISVIEPVSEAIEKTKTILFRPFDAEKWLVIGFCAWLASLIKGGFHGMSRFNHERPDHYMDEVTAKIAGFAGTHIVAISITIIAAAIFFVAILVLLLWLSSRGQFMFLDCLAKNKAQVIQPWQIFKRQANSLFGFRLLLTVIGFAVITALIVPIIFFAIAAKASSSIAIIAIVMIIVMALLIILASSILGLVQALAFDFVIPIMYLQKINVLAAWQRFWPILKCHFWKIMLYLLFKLLITMCIGAIVMFIFVLGCCCCCISVILLIPYIGTVILLPFPSFSKLYNLCFIRQFGSEFDVFSSAV
jgi:hypothetical protein